MDDIISIIPEAMKQSLAKLLDRKNEPNWKTIFLQFPESTFQKGDFETLRLAILNPNLSPTYQLIKKLGSKGIHVCQFISILEKLPADENIHEALDLFLGEPPSIDSQPPSEFELCIGDDLHIMCDAVSQQPLIFQWFKESTMMDTQTDKELVIKNVRQENEGLYICRVSNVRGYQFSRWVRVVVEKKTEERRKSTDSGSISPLKTEPSITLHPESVTLPYGSLLSLCCDGGGDPQPSFQWLKDEQEIQGATDRELFISPVSQDNQGIYTCRLFNDAGTANSRSADVYITNQLFARGNKPQEETKPQEDTRVFDKVALLIGNKDYKYSDRLGKLFHPTNDVRDIAGVLQSIGFKVISLVNLTLDEMRYALQLFSNLLDSGVYALFYFAGHGFEAKGKSYLMPVNASNEYKCSENLPTNEVLHAMQEREARLKVMLIDCCRTTPDNQGKQKFHDPISTGDLNAEQENVVIAFGCCSQGRVFEHSRQRNGYFAIHLLKHLGDEKNVEQVLLDVAKGVRSEQIVDNYTGHIQMVFRHSSLAEHWCLCDEINPNHSSHTSHSWKKGHELPVCPVTIYERFDVLVVLNFNAEFSNVIIVRAKIDTDDKDIILGPLKYSLPENKMINGCCVEEIGATDNAMFEKFANGEIAVKISDLQRLQGPLSVKFEVCYITGSNRSINDNVEYTFNERPLYARLTQQKH